MSAPSVQVETITPEKAAAYRAKSAPNRTLNLGRARRLAQQMLDGEWEVSNDAISFNAQGELDNGQHRLWAVEASGMAQSFIVMRHSSSTVFTIMDDVKKRSLADVLGMENIPSASVIAAATVKIHAYANNGNFQSMGYRNVTLKAAHAWAMLNQNDLVEAARIGGRSYSAISLSTSIGAACAYLFGVVDVQDRNDFFEKLTKGAGLGVYDPIYALRDRIVRNTNEAHKADNTYVSAWMIKGWNAYRAGSQVRQIKYSPGGASPEKFPEISGLDRSKIWP